MVAGGASAVSADRHGSKRSRGVVIKWSRWQQLGGSRFVCDLTPRARVMRCRQLLAPRPTTSSPAAL